MKTWIYSLLILCLSFIISSSALGQDEAFIWEPYQIHNYADLAEAQNDPELLALDGFVTWRLYLELTAGEADVPDYLYFISGSDEPGSVPLIINFNCCHYQHPQGSPIGTNISSFLLGVIPSLEYDTWVTIGGVTDTSDVSVIVAEDPNEPWVNNFEDPNFCDPNDPGSIELETAVGGGWFILPGEPEDSDASGDENNRVLIGQFTIPAGCTLQDETSACIQYNIDGNQDSVVTNCFALPALDPCFTQPIILETDTVIDNICQGASNGEIHISALTNATNISYEIIPPLGIQTTPGVFTELPTGDYELRIINNEVFDALGENCFTSEFLTVGEPETAVSGSLEILTDVQCLGDSTGVVQITIDENSGTPFTVGDQYMATTDFGVFGEFTSPNIFVFDSLDATIDPIQFFITDSNMCVLNLEVLLGPDDVLLAEGDVSNITCNGLNDGVIGLTISGGDNPVATWQAPLSGNSLVQTGLEPDDYSVIIDDGVTCPITLEFTITEPEAIVLENVSAEVLDCFGDCNGTVLFTASGGSGDLTSVILQGINPVENGALCAGATQLTILDTNNCSVTENLVIGENPELFFNGIVTDVQCNAGTDGSMVVSGSSGGVGAYTFTPADIYDPILESYINLSAQQYTFTMTDELNCSKDTVITITEPAPFVTQSTFTNVLCNGASDGTATVSAEGGSGTYTFFINGGDSNTTGEFTGLAPNTYEITGEDETGCPFIIEEALIISEPDPLSIQALAVTEPECGGDANATASVVPEGGTPDYFFNWNGGAVSAFPSQTGLSAGENSLLITDANGCQKDTLFTINEPEEIIIVIAAENVSCTGMCDGSFQAAATPVGSVELNFGNISNNDLCEGEYPVIATDEFGCVKLDTIVIGVDIISDIEYTVFTTPVSCFDEADGTATIAVTGGQGEITYDWSDPSSQNTATAIGLVEDFYTVTITDEIGCTFTEELFIEPTIGCFYISNALTPNGDGFNDEWELGGFEYFPDNKIEVFNRWGQKVFESVGPYTPWNGQFNSNRLPVADYYYVITYDPSSPPLTGTVTLKY